jgi:AMMECR1 domain-containing protein
MSASPSPPPSAESIATVEHALFCFDVLSAHLSPASTPRTASPAPQFANATDDYAVFVTWNTLRPGREPRLRGCIGNFTPRELGEQLREYALIACVVEHVPGTA